MQAARPVLATGYPIGERTDAQRVRRLAHSRRQPERDTEPHAQRDRRGERQVELRNKYALQHNAGGRGSGVSVVNILTTERV